MSMFTVDPTDQKARLEQKVHELTKIRDSAEDAYRKDPDDRMRRVEFFACQRVLVETRAMLAEWDDA